MNLPHDPEIKPESEQPEPEQLAEISRNVWLPISPKQVVVSIVSHLTNLIWVIGALLLALFINPIWFIAVAVAGIAFLVDLMLIPRRVRYTQYQLREDDVLIRSGVMFRQMTAVPYGRLQVVDIASGPLERKLGLARLKVSTASISSTVTLPGLVMQDAQNLRDLLIHVAESRRAGL